MLSSFEILHFAHSLAVMIELNTQLARSHVFDTDMVHLEI